MLDIWFLDNDKDPLDWDAGDWDLEDGMFVCTANTERCKCNHIRSIGVAFALYLGVGVASVIGAGAGHEIGFETTCMDGLPGDNADAAEKAQG